MWTHFDLQSDTPAKKSNWKCLGSTKLSCYILQISLNLIFSVWRKKVQDELTAKKPYHLLIILLCSRRDETEMHEIHGITLFIFNEFKSVTYPRLSLTQIKIYCVKEEAREEKSLD